MSPHLANLLLLGLLGSAYASAEDLPEAFPPDRYQKLVQNSPFSVATPDVPKVEAGPGPFANLFVMGIAKMRDAEGVEKDFVTIKSREDQTSFFLFGTEANKEGISIAGVEWSERVGKSKVTVKRGTEFGTLEFDQANLQSAPPAATAARPAMAPGSPGGGMPGRPPGVVLPSSPSPMISGPKPPANRNQPVVPRPSSVPPAMTQPQMAPGAGAPLNAPGGAQSPDARRRIRVISSQP